MNLVQALLTVLKKRGASEIFGIPGDFVLPFFHELEQSAILPLYSLSHEPAVAFAADAASRIGQHLGVVAVTYGAGALNLVNAVAQAYAERAPLVVIAGCPSQAESQSGLYLHHQVKTLDSQITIFREITCAQVRLEDPEFASEAIARILARAVEESRPVLIELPRDMAQHRCREVQDFRPEEPTHPALDECCENLLARIWQAKKPVMLVGVEIRRYGIEARVAELAQKLNMPVLTTLMGKGLLAEHPCAPLTGTYLGRAGNENANALVEQADLLVMIGVILSDSNFGVSPQILDMRKVLMLNHRQVNIGYYAYHGIALPQLVQAFTQSLPAAANSGDQIKPHKPGLVFEADQTPLAPLDVAQAIDRLFGEYGRMPVASDVGDCLFAGLLLEPTLFVAPGYYASMGYGVPAGLGIQAATGLRPLILVGDGAFQMTGWELGNCRRYGWNPIVVLFNNQSWEMIRAFAPQSRCADLGDWHYARLAEDLGGRSYRVADRAGLWSALVQAMEDRSCFQLIEVMLKPGALSPTLEAFARGIKGNRDGKSHSVGLTA